MSRYLREGTSDVLTLTRRNLVRYRRRPDVIVLMLIQPLIMLLLFRYVIGGAIHIPGVDYVEYLTPAVVAIAVINASVTLGVGLAEDLMAGVVDRIRVLPTVRPSFLVARVVTDVARNLFVIPMVAVLGLAVGFHFTTTGPNIVLAFALLIALGFAFAWISILLALWSGSPEATQGLAVLLFVVAAFLSSGFVPIATMPSGLRGVANASPVTHVDNALRVLTTGASGPVTHEVLAAFIWIAAIVAVTVPLALKGYSRYTQ